MTRRTNLHLPTRMRHAHGAYYFDDPQTKKWVPLGRDFDEAMGAYAPLALDRGVRFIPPTIGRVLFLRAKRSAKQRGIDFQITQAYVEYLLRAANNRCSISGVRLNVTHDGRWLRNPWAPSIDRIESRLSYQEGNCRIVCYAANVALNEWGLDVLRTLARGILDIGGVA